MSTMADIHDSGALSGPLAGVSFIIGVAGGRWLWPTLLTRVQALTRRRSGGTSEGTRALPASA